MVKSMSRLDDETGAIESRPLVRVDALPVHAGKAAPGKFP